MRTIDEEEVYKEVNVAMVTCQGGGLVGLGLSLVYYKVGLEVPVEVRGGSGGMLMESPKVWLIIRVRN